MSEREARTTTASGMVWFAIMIAVREEALRC